MNKLILIFSWKQLVTGDRELEGLEKRNRKSKDSLLHFIVL
jgi:hypothetical protein